MSSAHRALLPLFLAIGCLAATRPAAAAPFGVPTATSKPQEHASSPPSHPTHRRDVTFGLGLGISTITEDCDGCGSAVIPSLQLIVGKYLTQRTALLFAPMLSAIPGYSGNLFLGSLAIRHWALPRKWLEASAGLLSITTGHGDAAPSETHFGPIVSCGMGVDATVDDFTFDLSGRVSIGRVGGDGGNVILFSVNIGTQWR